jgi:hypothetical protein
MIPAGNHANERFKSKYLPLCTLQNRQWRWMILCSGITKLWQSIVTVLIQWLASVFRSLLIVA